MFSIFLALFVSLMNHGLAPVDSVGAGVHTAPVTSHAGAPRHGVRSFDIILGPLG